MLTLIQVDMHKLAPQITGWDTPLGRAVCEARMTCSIEGAKALAAFGGYRKVADLSTDSPDVAYQTAQSLRQHWTVDNPLVTKLHVASHIASMSMGDILLVSGDATNYAYLCSGEGWVVIGADDTAAILNSMENAQ